MDVMLAGALLIGLFPLLMVVAVLAACAQGGRLLFIQERPGLHGKPFKVYKFRTMRPGPAPDAERLTPVGRFLRRASLDEAPQLINILKGDMSFIGPRPLLMEYLPLYDARQRKRHDVRPGLTGLAQIKGRNEQRWRDRFRWDVRYVEHWSLRLDAYILCRTLPALLRGGGTTIEKFKGNDA